MKKTFSSLKRLARYIRPYRETFSFSDPIYSSDSGFQRGFAICYRTSYYRNQP